MTDPTAADAPVQTPAPESDLSPRKLKIALGCLIGQTFATWILPVSAASLVLVPMTQEFHWSRTEYSFHTTCHMMFGAFSAWLAGRLTDRIGAKPVVIVGAIAIGLTTLAMSRQTASLPQFYLYYALFGFFGSTWLAYTKIVAALFTRHRGKAIAILGAEQTVLAAFTPVMTNALMLHFGWRGMYVAYGVLILAVVPLLFLLLEEPGKGSAAAAAKPGATAKAFAPPPTLEGMTIGQVLGDGVFWLILLAGVIGVCITSGMVAHIVAAYEGKGFTQTQAAETQSLSMLFGVPGMFLGGWVIDKIHTAKVAAPFNLAASLGGFLLLMVSASFGGMPLLIASGALTWFSFNAYRPMASYFHTRFFGLRSYTEVTGVQFTIMNPIMALSAPAVGLIYDTTHSYDIVFKLMIVTPLLAAIVWLLMPRYRYSASVGLAPEAPPVSADSAPAPAIAAAE
jgi:MFS family permease